MGFDPAEVEGVLEDVQRIIRSDEGEGGVVCIGPPEIFLNSEWGILGGH